MKLRTGFGLFIACLFVMMGIIANQFIAGAIGFVLFGMFFPSWRFLPGYLATGTLTAEEELKQRDLLDKISKQTVDLLAKAAAGHMTKAEFDAELKKVNDSIKSMNDETIKSFKDKMDELGKKNEEAIKTATEKAETEIKEVKLELKKIQDKAVDPSRQTEVLSFKAALLEAFNEMNTKAGGAVIKTVKDVHGERLSMKDYFEAAGKMGVTPPIQIKTLVDMLESSIVNSNVALVRLTEMDPQRVGFPLNPYQHAISIFPVKNMAKPTMSILVTYEYEDGAGAKTEGSAPSKSSFKLKTVEFKACVIGTYFTLSDETLDDLDEVMDEIAIIAPDKILNNFDDKVFRTTGTDDGTDIMGLFNSTKSTAFDFNTYIGEIQTADLVDLIQTMKLQAETNGYIPTVVGLHPRDAAKLAALKNTLTDDKTSARVVRDGLGQATAVCGMKIVTNPEITVNTCFVADMRQPVIGRRKGMTMTIGYNGTDLTEGQRTVALNIRLAFGVRDKAGVIYSANNNQNIAWISHS